MDQAIGSVAEKVLDAIALFSPAELRDEPETTRAFAALITALCRLNERVLRIREYRDNQEPQAALEDKSKNGLPEELAGNIHEGAKLL